MIVARRAVVAGVAALLLRSRAAQSQSPVLSLQGKVKRPQHWTLADLRKLPAQQAAASFESRGGPVTGNFTGPSLWSLIVASGGVDDQGNGFEVRHTIRISATDDYSIILSTGELDPNFGATTALIAYERDGKPLNDFRLVMPGDKYNGRYVHDVVTIAVE
jgi:DMSO/TMAO reductase YedYZ molybdopterin-dependent catalytic subunit